MDKEGYVSLDVIGRFNRVRALTHNTAIIRDVSCKSSLLIFLVPVSIFALLSLYSSSHPVLIPLLQSLVGSVIVELDSLQEKLRQRDGWFHWVVTPRNKDFGDFSENSPLSPPYSPLGEVGLDMGQGGSDIAASEVCGD